MNFLNTIEQTAFSAWVRESGSIWAFPTILVAHTIGMALVAGTSVYVALALLGFWPKMPLKPLEKLYPLMWWGFAVNAITGTMLLMADISTKLTNWDFFLKMLFIFAGVWVLQRTRTTVFGDPNLDQAPVKTEAKRLAWAAIVCWFMAIVCGRLLAYVGPVPGLAKGN